MGKAPVFVDDSGTRKRLLRIAGVLISLLSVGFLTVVGVALAVPPVNTSVGLGDVAPFIVPGAAAPPPSKVPAARATRHPGTPHTGSGHPSPSGRQTGGQTDRPNPRRGPECDPHTPSGRASSLPVLHYGEVRGLRMAYREDGSRRFSGVARHANL